MLFAIAWILPIAEAADPVVCQPGEQSVCQASSAYGLLAGYSPTTNISDVALIDLDVRNLGNATDDVLALSIYETGLNYSLQAKLPTGPLDLRALSTQAKGTMFDCAVGCPLKHYQMYFGIPPPQPPPPPRLRHRLTPLPLPWIHVLDMQRMILCNDSVGTCFENNVAAFGHGCGSPDSSLIPSLGLRLPGASASLGANSLPVIRLRRPAISLL